MNSDLFARLIGWAFIFITSSILFIIAIQFAVDRLCRLLKISWAVAYLVVHKRQFKAWQEEQRLRLASRDAGGAELG